ncbi:MAG: nuclear transport factor 2 family protein [Pseudomonadota bacterium]|nr:nuclear transport factor 2 family protein [Pseudomonadota bacterium]
MRTVSVLACVLLWTSHANAGPAEDALVAYDKFFAAFTTDNYEQITTFFAPDAQFYGTNSPEVVTNPEGIRTYFMRALNGARGATKATQFDRTALPLSDSVVAIAGRWQSERSKGGTTTTAGPSRSTVVMQKPGDRWFIVQFHNSPTPKVPAAAPLK